MTFFVRRALQLAGEVRHLRDEVTRLELALAISRDTVDQLSRKYQQALRDSELLACGWRDRQAALEFVRTAHDIDRQDTAS